jgi:hypothetical protein
MEVSSVASAPTQMNVKLQKGQQEQEAKVVEKLLESTGNTTPRAAFGSGQNVNITA